MTISREVNDVHLIKMVDRPSDTEAWLCRRAARYVLGTGVAGAGVGWAIENHDGSIVLARPNDTLVFDGERVTRQSGRRRPGGTSGS